MKFFLGEMQRRRFDLEAQRSFRSEAPKPEHFRLYNKNGADTLHVRVIGQCPYRHGWIVECDAVPDYFKSVLQPESA